MIERALLTGAAGQDGSYLADALLALGVEVHGLVRGEPDERDGLVEGVVAHVGDLADIPETGRLVERLAPDLVVNLAAISSVARSWADPVGTATVNGTAVAGLLDACARVHESGRPIRFVQASSGEIFSGSGVTPQTEDAPIRPTSPYGAAKAFAHHLVTVWRARGLFASNAILYNHESPRRPEDFLSRKVTRGVAAIALGDQDVLRLGDLDVARDWGWAPDVADALVRIARADAPDDFVVATGTARTAREFVAAAFAAAGIDDWESHVVIDAALFRPVEAPLLVGDATRIRTRLGWRPTTTFEEIVAAMVEHDLAELRRARVP